MTLQNSRLGKSMCYSLAGLKDAWQGEASFRQEVLLTIILLPLAFLSDKSGTQKALLVSSVLLIIIVELLNSAIESAIDRIGEEKTELSRRAKDIGSAAVFTTIINMAAVWCCIFLL